MTDIATLVRSARRSRRFSQRELARRAGLSQSRVAIAENAHEDPRFDTASRLLAGAGHRLYAAATTRDDVATIAADIRYALARDDRGLAFRFFIQMNDHLVAERGLLRGILAITEPESTGSKTWDAAIAALVDYRLSQEGVPAPTWTSAATRHLERARPLAVDPADPVPPRAEVPAEFLDHGVLVWRDSLESV
ncbi:helix-turn-helix domain-containing protein [Agromyces aurantiacus]|uniref:Helix-turn-helix domain-containing protein n=1 Tax=Agromyces aurantiacus TaxID=165814 RepID=A0ABV9R4K3_9MICO|nr:helix-turn-helix domain-containing protein [Agromyces aurantiacus]MBM7503746.1 transcriptional regulator with XRE-family HTH domain [Agromyces aurantiacus]